MDGDTATATTQTAEETQQAETPLEWGTDAQGAEPDAIGGVSEDEYFSKPGTKLKPDNKIEDAQDSGDETDATDEAKAQTKGVDETAQAPAIDDDTRKALKRDGWDDEAISEFASAKPDFLKALAAKARKRQADNDRFAQRVAEQKKAAEGSQGKGGDGTQTPQPPDLAKLTQPLRDSLPVESHEALDFLAARAAKADAIEAQLRETRDQFSRQLSFLTDRLVQREFSEAAAQLGDRFPELGTPDGLKLAMEEAQALASTGRYQNAYDALDHASRIVFYKDGIDPRALREAVKRKDRLRGQPMTESASRSMPQALSNDEFEARYLQIQASKGKDAAREWARRVRGD